MKSITRVGRLAIASLTLVLLAACAGQKEPAQKFISDIGGQDIRAHESKPEGAVRAVRDWLRRDVKGVLLPGGTHLCAAYERFTSEWPRLCAPAKLDAAELTFTDYYDLLETWLRTTR